MKKRKIGRVAARSKILYDDVVFPLARRSHMEINNPFLNFLHEIA